MVQEETEVKARPLRLLTVVLVLVDRHRQVISQAVVGLDGDRPPLLFQAG